MNPNGNAASLEATRAGNANRLVHGLYSTKRQELSAEARELVSELMSAPHTVPLDAVAIVELASLLDLIGKVDAALADGIVERRGRPRALVDMRVRLSGRLQKWLEAVGLTPEARSQWAARLARPSLADELAALTAQNRDEP